MFLRASSFLRRTPERSVLSTPSAQLPDYDSSFDMKSRIIFLSALWSWFCGIFRKDIYKYLSVGLCARAGYCRRCKPQLSPLWPTPRRPRTQPPSQSPKSKYSFRVRNSQVWYQQCWPLRIENLFYDIRCLDLRDLRFWFIHNNPESDTLAAVLSNLKCRWVLL